MKYIKSDNVFAILYFSSSKSINNWFRAHGNLLIRDFRDQLQIFTVLKQIYETKGKQKSHGTKTASYCYKREKERHTERQRVVEREEGRKGERERENISQEKRKGSSYIIFVLLNRGKGQQKSLSSLTCLGWQVCIWWFEGTWKTKYKVVCFLTKPKYFILIGQFMTFWANRSYWK